MNLSVRGSGLLLWIVVGAVLAIAFGSFFPEAALHTEVLGVLFLNALKMMVLPLIITSIIVGVMSLGDVRRLGTLGIKTLLYYMLTTGISVAIGIALVLILKPGVGFPTFGGPLPEAVRTKGAYSVVDLLTGLIYPNLVQAAMELKILPIIVASLFFGVAFSMLGEEKTIVAQFFSACNEAVMKIVHGIMYFAPLGIFGLIAFRLGSTGGGGAVWDLLVQLGKYVGTVVLGLAIHGVIVLPMILYLLAGRNPGRYFRQLAKALLTAFATASSSSTLPLTLECVTEEAGVSNETAGFVLPLGATINMDGTALYEAVAAIFIAQSYGISLGGGELVVIFLTATLAAIGAAGIPEAGLVTMVLVLQSVGLPVEGIGMILAVDWLLDRCRTMVNVWGDAVGAAVVDHLEKRRP
ncbi:MAG: dicarboxylate/amino acid:cation symporter [Deltaproteobacteria bacterium]|nr:dicarboxylate/amino acid:cation symporter [Deltaproteobacteria bacterium]